jgi:zinc and cadmium transporter
MSLFWWILLSSLAMSLIAWVGLFAFYLKEKQLKKILFPLVAFAAGALLGGAMLHMIPEAVHEAEGSINVFVWVLVGFSMFFLLEQFIHWHHCHKAPSEHKRPVTYLILVADALHNFLCGMAIASAFVIDIRLGIITWLVAATHEIPQEIGDFGILIHGGWDKTRALIFNFLSALTVILGALTVYFMSGYINTALLLAIAAGNFIYIASSDLIPEIKHSENLRGRLLHFSFFIFGLGIIYLTNFFE